MKLDALANFVPLYFSRNFNFLLPLFPGAIVELENSVFELFLKITIQIYTSICGYLDRRKET